MATQSSVHIYDLSTMSRPDTAATRRIMEGPSPMMSYPQRIAVMLARAPKPPTLRRAKSETPVPLSPETRANLIAVHTLNATLGYHSP